ncbi:hypothetical protein [Corynebacterium aquatimens]|uniref:hypothetical protein n=1 Tax=Corynebacterium aquatimens TaxID=1190508 RepID=UPI0025410102|nr:hypothetical protein [Corynebacterium aquatimens]
MGGPVSRIFAPAGRVASGIERNLDADLVRRLLKDAESFYIEVHPGDVMAA